MRPVERGERLLQAVEKHSALVPITFSFWGYHLGRHLGGELESEGGLACPRTAKDENDRHAPGVVAIPLTEDAVCSFVRRFPVVLIDGRSEERRVGKECRS